MPGYHLQDIKPVAQQYLYHTCIVGMAWVILVLARPASQHAINVTGQHVSC